MLTQERFEEITRIVTRDGAGDRTGAGKAFGNL